MTAITGGSDVTMAGAVDGGHSYFVADGRGDDTQGVWVHNAKKYGLNKNSNRAVSRFGIYEIKVNGQLHKIGKADLNRITQSTQLPTRLHQQLRILRQVHGRNAVNGRVVVNLGVTTTLQAKISENLRLRKFFESFQMIPLGNIKSFMPTI